MLVYFLRHASAGVSAKSIPSRTRSVPSIATASSNAATSAVLSPCWKRSVDAIISSPLKRATQTAALVANELAYEGKIDLDPALRPDATWAQFRDLLTRYGKQEAIMVVGHNPNLSEFLGRLIGGGKPRRH